MGSWIFVRRPCVPLQVGCDRAPGIRMAWPWLHIHWWLQHYLALICHKHLMQQSMGRYSCSCAEAQVQARRRGCLIWMILVMMRSCMNCTCRLWPFTRGSWLLADPGVTSVVVQVIVCFQQELQQVPHTVFDCCCCCSASQYSVRLLLVVVLMAGWREVVNNARALLCLGMSIPYLLVLRCLPLTSSGTGASICGVRSTNK